MGFEAKPQYLALGHHSDTQIPPVRSGGGEEWLLEVWRHGSFKRQQWAGAARETLQISHQECGALNENHSKALGVIKWNSLLYSTQELLSVYMRPLFYFMYMIILYRRVWKEL